MSRMKKTIAILLAVLFLVSLNVSSVVALNPQPEPPDVPPGHIVHPPSPGGVLPMDNGGQTVIGGNGNTNDKNTTPFDYLLNLIKYIYNLIFGNSDNGVIKITSHPVLK